MVSAVAINLEALVIPWRSARSQHPQHPGPLGLVAGTWPRGLLGSSPNCNLWCSSLKLGMFFQDSFWFYINQTDLLCYPREPSGWFKADDTGQRGPSSEFTALVVWFFPALWGLLGEFQCVWKREALSGYQRRQWWGFQLRRNVFVVSLLMLQVHIIRNHPLVSNSTCRLKNMFFLSSSWQRHISLF